MKRVIDASVAVKLVIDEEHSVNALRLLAEADLSAPAHWLGEVGTTLWAKSMYRGVLTREQAAERLDWLCQLAIAEIPIRVLMRRATELAFELRATVYDTLYLAVAEREHAPLVTADRKLFDRVAADERFAHLITWIAAYP